MADWWNALSGLERFFALTAIPATLLLLIQTVLLLFGLGGHGQDDVSADHDGDGLDQDGGQGWEQEHSVGEHDGHDHGEIHDAGLRMFTVRGFVAFFSVFGWCGLVCLQGGLSPQVSLLISFAAGLVSMLAIALIIKAAMKLQINGTLDLANAVGQSASVYMRVPAGRAGRGKVNLTVQERYIEADAVTDEAADLMPGREVAVVGLLGGNALLVTRLIDN
ncbi:MAG: hypothetical protein LBT60_05670 [Oscillospiraceae bacterium]|jgi:hypothetical protein|nr:hypothetical protein [Oscillospiraceae bacterium]